MRLSDKAPETVSMKIIFSVSFLGQTYIVGTDWNCLGEVILRSTLTHFQEKIKLIHLITFSPTMKTDQAASIS